MRVVAVSDVGGAVANEGGLDAGALADHVEATGSVVGFAGGEPITEDQMWDLECELFVPAALGGVIDEAVARRLQADVVVEAANGPTTLVGQAILEERGVVVVPDILANAGGVTASYFEWAQSRQGFPWEESQLAERLRSRMDDAFVTVWARAQQLGVDLRRAAYVVALDRIAAAIEARGLFP
jgi:glutamate dehydrogenase (NAD(P)+)